MSADPTTATAEAANGQTDELQHEIEQTRSDLGDTVDELVTRVNPKARAKDAAARAKGRMRAATTDGRGRPTAAALVAVAAGAAAIAGGIVMIWRRR